MRRDVRFYTVFNVSSSQACFDDCKSSLRIKSGYLVLERKSSQLEKCDSSRMRRRKALVSSTNCLCHTSFVEGKITVFLK